MKSHEFYSWKHSWCSKPSLLFVACFLCFHQCCANFVQNCRDRPSSELVCMLDCCCPSHLVFKVAQLISPVLLFTKLGKPIFPIGTKANTCMLLYCSSCLAVLAQWRRDVNINMIEFNCSVLQRVTYVLHLRIDSEDVVTVGRWKNSWRKLKVNNLRHSSKKLSFRREIMDPTYKPRHERNTVSRG